MVLKYREQWSKSRGNNGLKIEGIMVVKIEGPMVLKYRDQWS